MIWLVLGAFASSFLVSWIAGFFVRPLAIRWGLIDNPGARKVHVQPTPLGGGLAIWLGVMIPLALGALTIWLLHNAKQNAQSNWLSTFPWPEILRTHLDGLLSRTWDLALMLAIATGLFLVGLADDRRALHWKPRLAFQFLAAAAVAYGLGWRLTLHISAPLLTGLVTMFWIVWLVNSFNMLDNMDCLSGGIALIASLILATLLLAIPSAEKHGPQLFIAGFLLLLAGATAGFLMHNRPPAKMFMGDGGAYFLGFCIAVCTILATFSGDGLPKHSVLAPLCVLATPLYDTISVLAIRLREGRSPFQGDKSHFSHRLVDLGLTKPQAVATVHLATATCGLGAFLLHESSLRGAVIVMLMLLGVLSLLAILEIAARRKISQHREQKPS